MLLNDQNPDFGLKLILFGLCLFIFGAKLFYIILKVPFYKYRANILCGRYATIELYTSLLFLVSCAADSLNSSYRMDYKAVIYIIVLSPIFIKLQDCLQAYRITTLVNSETNALRRIYALSTICEEAKGFSGVDEFKIGNIMLMYILGKKRVDIKNNLQFKQDGVLINSLPEAKNFEKSNLEAPSLESFES